MNDLATFQHDLDQLDTGLPESPDLAGIRSAGRTQRRRRRALQGLAAAAVLAVLVPTAVPALRPSLPLSASGARFAGDPGAGGFVILDQQGWQVRYVSAVDGQVEVQYARDSEELDVTEYAASTYASYYEDRADLGNPQALQVLGQDATCGPTRPTTTPPSGPRRGTSSWRCGEAG